MRKSPFFFCRIWFIFRRVIIVLAPQKAFGQGIDLGRREPPADGGGRPLEVRLMRVNAAFTLTNAGYDSDVYYGYLDEAVP
jgi:hypothetical protein